MALIRQVSHEPPQISSRSGRGLLGFALRRDQAAPYGATSPMNTVPAHVVQPDSAHQSKNMKDWMNL